MLSRRRKSKNWSLMSERGFGSTAATRDVQADQSLERGERDEVSNPWPRRILAIIMAIVFGVIALVMGFAGMYIFEMMQVLVSGESIIGIEVDFGRIQSDWRVWAFAVVTTFLSGLILYERLMAGWRSENSMVDSTDINTHTNDQNIMLNEQMQEEFDWFPDVGAHSSVQVSSMLSHMMLSNKGLKKIKRVERYDKNVVNKDTGEIVHYKGDVVRNGSGKLVYKTDPLIDEDFGQELLTASNIPLASIDPNAKEVRKAYDVRGIEYNPPVPGDERKEKPNRVDRDKLGYDTVDDLINNDWDLPLYEVQRPAGAYLVDTAPVNTMVLAITRAGKGQTVIEPTIDMWTREKRQNNIIINDPKGELLVMFYVPATVRGYEIVQFNLINVMKTDVYNPIGFAAEFARQGNYTQAAAYIENIGDVFFPKDGGDDPMWPNAANNAFKRTVFGLIDYYLEEEKQMRREAEVDGTSEMVLMQRLDDMWGRVSLYNAYQLFVVLSSRKSSDVEQIRIDEDEEVKEKDFLTLFFDATAKLPTNEMRKLVDNTDRSLRAMAGSDKTIASVYGIAITGMSFFVDPTISTLTSGKPSQNFDAEGLSFPRRMGVRFAPEWLNRYPMAGMMAEWSAYKDKDFTDQYDPKDFSHSELIDRTGWARHFFDGKFTQRKNYIKLQIKNPDTGMLIHEFYFELILSYKTTLNGKSYVKDPILKEQIIRDGVLRELKKKKTRDGKIRFVYAETLVRRRYRNLNEEDAKEKIIKVPAFTQKIVNYTEKPKMVFFITPPHLQSYAKLILILIKQMVDANFESSYTTKASQKPLYKTRYMLDELGNLQSEGTGIPGLQTMLSIGLGQDQQFTLILQTLQQLKDVYGDSVDKVIQGNVGNIVFLKSTDDSMIETLEKLSGKTHESLIEQKTITRDNEALLSKNEGRISYTMNTKERSVIQFNDMLFIPDRNSMVFRAGQSPIWNRRETILPMSWRLFQNTIKEPGKDDYTLQTVPTLSTALDFDIRKNQPDFFSMVRKRVDQAREVDYMRERYMDVHGYTEDDMARLDPDVLSDELMIAINEKLYGTGIDKNAVENTPWGKWGFDTKEEWQQHMAKIEREQTNDMVRVSHDNSELTEEIKKHEAEDAEAEMKIYAGGRISKRMLINQSGSVNMQLQNVFAEAYADTKQHFGDSSDLIYNPETESLRNAKTGKNLIVSLTEADEKAFNKAIKDQDSRVYSEDDNIAESGIGRFEVKPEFIKYLASLSSWKHIAGGRFEKEVGHKYERWVSMD